MLQRWLAARRRRKVLGALAYLDESCRCCAAIALLARLDSWRTYWVLQRLREEGLVTEEQEGSILGRHYALTAAGRLLIGRTGNMSLLFPAAASGAR